MPHCDCSNSLEKLLSPLVSQFVCRNWSGRFDHHPNETVLSYALGCINFTMLTCTWRGNDPEDSCAYLQDINMGICNKYTTQRKS